ncbi:uncharacterized protein LOC126668479 [Mercurialis annua]|uniref:uncharacterized protein LOC126668479 n=1 Tax=Mercurialis annua TaxID=3986 RepID=UPI00215E047A|nr:uncharacterized protein LOC126668479 [Mercurialis annua]
MAIDEVDKWIIPIIKYLENDQLLIVQKKPLSNFANPPLEKCVSVENGRLFLKEIHEGICGGHEGDNTIARKTMLQDYYWPTIKEDAKELMKNVINVKDMTTLAIDRLYHKALYKAPGFSPCGEWT